MANLCYNCQDALNDHQQNDCGEELKGGASGVLLLECDHQLTDPSNAVQVQAEIDAGRATLVLGVKVGIGAPSPVKVTSNVACTPQKTVNYDRTGSYVDGNVNNNNVAFYNQVKKRVFGGMVIYECGTADSDAGAQVSWIDAVVRFEGGRILPAEDSEFQRWEGQFTWKGIDDPAIYTAPAGIFD